MFDDYLTILPKIRSTYDGRLIDKTSYEGCKAYLQFSCKIVGSSEIVFVNDTPKRNPRRRKSLSLVNLTINFR